MGLLAAELIYGGSHLVVKLFVKLTLLGFVPAPEMAETIRRRQTKQSLKRARCSEQMLGNQINSCRLLVQRG